MKITVSRSEKAFVFGQFNANLSVKNFQRVAVFFSLNTRSLLILFNQLIAKQSECDWKENREWNWD